MRKLPRPGDIFYLEKDKPYQVITIGIHKETCENMVIYQALFGDFKTFVLPLSKFMNEMQDNIKGTDTDQKETEKDAVIRDAGNIAGKSGEDNVSVNDKNKFNISDDDNKVNDILLSFLDAKSYSKKLEIITTNIKAIDDRLINNMAASLDCTVNDGPLEQRLQELIYCLKQMSRFEDRRLR